MQALPLRSAGTALSSASENRTSLHQQSTSKLPAAETAQSLGLPQTGHSGAYRGGVVMRWSLAGRCRMDQPTRTITGASCLTEGSATPSSVTRAFAKQSAPAGSAVPLWAERVQIWLETVTALGSS